MEVHLIGKVKQIGRVNWILHVPRHFTPGCGGIHGRVSIEEGASSVCSTCCTRGGWSVTSVLIHTMSWIGCGAASHRLHWRPGAELCKGCHVWHSRKGAQAGVVH